MKMMTWTMASGMQQNHLEAVDALVDTRIEALERIAAATGGVERSRRQRIKTMNVLGPHFRQLRGLALSLAVLALASCGHKDSDGHEHGEGAPSGASYEMGKGIILTEETRKSLGVETAEVAERKLPLIIQFSAHVFGEDHKAAAVAAHHADCTVKAAGLVAQDRAAGIRAGQSAHLAAKSGETYAGVVLRVSKALTGNEAEVIIGITNAGAGLNQGEFLSAQVAIAREQIVLAVPRSALLRSAEGSFVYAVNGDAYHRTAVKTGAETDEFIEITDGVRSSDAVVTRPVEKLYLIELRATKGGGHSH